MQAQVQASPYIALWSRLRASGPDELAQLVTERGAVRMGLQRATIHSSRHATPSPHAADPAARPRAEPPRRQPARSPARRGRPGRALDGRTCALGGTAADRQAACRPAVAALARPRRCRCRTRSACCCRPSRLPRGVWGASRQPMWTTSSRSWGSRSDGHRPRSPDPPLPDGLRPGERAGHRRMVRPDRAAADRGTSAPAVADVPRRERSGLPRRRRCSAR